MILLELLRRKQRYTQSMLAKAANVPQSYISRAESDVVLYPAQLERIAAVLGYDENPADLLCEIDELVEIAESTRKPNIEEAKLHQLLNDVAVDNGISPKVVTRACNCLNHNGITAIAQLAKMSATDLFELRSMGAKSVELCCYAIESINAQGIQDFQEAQ